MSREPATLEGPGRFQTSIQMSPDARDLLHGLALTMGVSKTDILEISIRELGGEYLSPVHLAAMADPPGSRRRHTS